jgi:UDP-N-acetyl-2-amino-2-deoxyglucuronate dehydrogenase
MKNFAMTGVAGYVAPRHLKAIHDTGNRLVAAVDPHDSVGILDRWFADVAYFTEFERFDRHLELLRRRNAGDRVEWLTVCAPNHLHDAHVRLALRVGANALCEKPLVLNPWNLDALAELEAESSHRVFTVLQLRVHPALISLKQRLDGEPGSRRHDVRLTYITGRGPWYRYSWKGDPQRSGGVATNIGIHFFDLLMWLFGPVASQEVHLASGSRAAGHIELDRANITWFLSIEASDLPVTPKPGDPATYRSVTVDGEEVEFSGGFSDLHTRVYEETLAGRGFGIEDARPSVDLVHAIRHTEPVRPSGPHHPLVERVAR